MGKTDIKSRRLLLHPTKAGFVARVTNGTRRLTTSAIGMNTTLRQNKNLDLPSLHAIYDSKRGYTHGFLFSLEAAHERVLE